MQSYHKRAFTIVELLVVIGIIGLLAALLLPAIQASRESGRRVQCANQLKQLGLGMLNHHETIKAFPSGGWGILWVPDPDRGSGLRQPGGTLYNILPYIEQGTLHKTGAGLPENSPEKRAALARLIETPVVTFFCPTRRPPIARDPGEDAYINCNRPTKLGKTDYAVCAGDQAKPELGGGPRNYADGDSNVSGKDWWSRNSGYSTVDCTGVSFLRSQVKMAHVKDGASKTYMLGEKYLAFRYYDVLEKSDDLGAFTGYQDDSFRTTNIGYPPTSDRDSYADNATDWFGFGSAHTTVFQMVFCDGSVHQVPFEVSSEVHRALGNRKDGVDPDNLGF